MSESEALKIASLIEEIVRLKDINVELLAATAEAFHSMETFECDARSQMPRLKAIIAKAREATS